MIEAGLKFGKLTVIGIRKFVSNGKTKMVALCLCECGQRVERNHRSIRASIQKNCMSSCGCFDKQLASKAAMEGRKDRLDVPMTIEELLQVERIVSERRGKTSFRDREEAKACVLADRRVNEMVCHDGAVNSL